MKRAIVLVAIPLAACPRPDVPTPADTAAYLNLAVGNTFVFEIDENLSESHEIAQSTILSDTGLVFEYIAKQNGFLKQERTFSIEVDVDSAQIVRLGDCIVECGELSAPISLFTVPFDEGEQTETLVEVTRTRNGEVEGTESESHTIIVGPEGEVTVPAGSFTGFPLSWRRQIGDADAQTALLTIVPGTGIVSWDGFDGAQLRRK